MSPLFTHDHTVVALATASLVIWTAIQIAVGKKNGGPEERSSFEWSFLVILLIATGSFAASIVITNLKVATIGGNPWWPVVAGLVVISLASAFRTWAIVTLGQFFNVMVTIQEDHRIVERGPYRLVRHPAYLGSILATTGFGLTEGDWVSVVVISLGALLAFAMRIRVEERALLDALGEPYASYTRRTSRLIPGLY